MNSTDFYKVEPDLHQAGWEDSGSGSPVLTIGFPTFNRCQTITRGVESIIGCASVLSATEYEILILDNASTDGTDEKVADLITRFPAVPIRYLRNTHNVGYDRNHLYVYQHARGKYVWFCSDRYVYNVDLALVLHIIRKHHPSVLTFSDLFRSVLPIAINSSLEYVYDDKLANYLKAEQHSHSGRPYLVTMSSNVISSGVLQIGVPIANVSDCIVYRDTDKVWIERLAQFDGTYMLVIAAQVHGFEQTQNRVAVLQLPWFTHAFQRMNSGGARHDLIRVAYGNLHLIDEFPFLGTKQWSARRHFRALISVYLHIASDSTIYEQPYEFNDILQYLEDASYVPSTLEKSLLWFLRVPWPKPVLRLLLRTLPAMVPVLKKINHLLG